MEKHVANKSTIVGLNGKHLDSPPVDHAAELYRESCVIAQACACKPLKEWTQAERFAAAVVAGAALCFREGHCETLYPVAIEEKGGRYRVTQVMSPPRQREKEGGLVDMPTKIDASFLTTLLSYRERIIKNNDGERYIAVQELGDWLQYDAKIPTAPTSPGTCEKVGEAADITKPVLEGEIPLDYVKSCGACGFTKRVASLNEDVICSACGGQECNIEYITTYEQRTASR